MKMFLETNAMTSPYQVRVLMMDVPRQIMNRDDFMDHYFQDDDDYDACEYEDHPLWVEVLYSYDQRHLEMAILTFTHFHKYKAFQQKFKHFHTRIME